MRQSVKKALLLMLCAVLLLSLLPASAAPVDQGKVLPGLCQIVDEAYALAEGEILPYEATLTGKVIDINTRWSEAYQNITVTIAVEGRENKPIVCYRMTGEGAEDVQVGDTVTATGALQNYAGTVEFNKPVMTQLTKGDAPVIPDRAELIVDQAYALEPGESLPYTATLTGTVTSIDSPWSDIYLNITVTMAVAGRENMPIQCYRLRGEYAENLTVGDIITVTGQLKNYNGKIEFTTGCTLNEVIGASPKPDEDLYSMAIVGSSLPGINDWDPTDPFGDMQQIGPCVYSKTLTFREACTIQFKFVGNDTWDDRYTFGAYWDDVPNVYPGDVKILEAGGWDLCMDIPGPCTVEFVLDLSQEAVLTVAPAETPEEMVTLSVYVPSTWEPAPGVVPWVYVYSWNDMGALLGDWPGIRLKKNGIWYQTEVPAEVINLVISERDGAQTADLYLEGGRDAWIVVAEQSNDGYTYPAEIFYYEPDIEDAPVEPEGPDYRVTGNAWWMGNWNPACAEGLMEKTETGVYCKIFEDVEPGDYELLITTNGVWNGAVGMHGMMTNFRFDVIEPGSTVEVTFFTETLRVEVCTVSPDGTVRHWDSDEQDSTLLHSLAIVGSGLPGINDWDPADPSGDMQEISPGIYSKTLTFTMPGNINFKFAGNDMWDDNWNIGGQGYPTGTIPGAVIELWRDPGSSDIGMEITGPCTLEFILDVNPTYPNLRVEVVEDIQNTVTLFVQTPNDWGWPCAYSWGETGNGLLGEWPGTAMELNGSWYELQIPDYLTNLIISDAGGSDHYEDWHMTDDLSLMPGMNVWLQISPDTNENGKYHTEIFYYEPDDYESGDNEPGIQDGRIWRVVGNARWMGDWDPASDAGLMEEKSPEVYTKTFYNVPAGTYEFKITCGGTWNNAMSQWDGSNFTFTVDDTCNVTVTFDMQDGWKRVDISFRKQPKGDMTGDGKLNVADTARLYAHIRGNGLTDPDALAQADLTGDGKVNIADVSKLYAYVRGVSPEAILDEAYDLPENTSMDREVTLTGQIIAIESPYSPEYRNITVLIEVRGCEDKPVSCYRMEGEDVDRVHVGDIITVTGTLCNYMGKVEFEKGCHLDEIMPYC